MLCNTFFLLCFHYYYYYEYDAVTTLLRIHDFSRIIICFDIHVYIIIHIVFIGLETWLARWRLTSWVVSNPFENWISVGIGSNFSATTPSHRTQLCTICKKSFEIRITLCFLYFTDFYTSCISFDKVLNKVLQTESFIVLHTSFEYYYTLCLSNEGSAP